tara:strand:- start:565 stop:792 length:228 start_codon:yes stop_codon:yes gene_type:complete
MSSIPSQDKLVSYTENIAEQPLSVETDLEQVAEQIPPLEAPFQSNLISSRKAKEMSRKNLKDLELLTGETFNINI